MASAPFRFDPSRRARSCREALEGVVQAARAAARRLSERRQKQELHSIDHEADGAGDRSRGR